MSRKRLTKKKPHVKKVKKKQKVSFNDFEDDVLALLDKTFKDDKERHD